MLGPETAGLALLPCALVFFLVLAAAAGRLAAARWRAGDDGRRHGRHRLRPAGPGQRRALANTLALAAAGLALTGMGMGLNTGPLMSVAVEAVVRRPLCPASALINVARMAGAAPGGGVPGRCVCAMPSR